MRDWVKAQKPTFGTCAGLIMLADRVTHQRKGGQDLIGGLDVTVDRNHFGSQLESFELNLDVADLREYFQRDIDEGSTQAQRAIFIRAPAIVEVGPKAQCLATCLDSNDKDLITVAVRQVGDSPT